MSNNTLFCGIALVVIGLVSFFMDTPTWDDRVNKYLDAHDAAVDKYPAEKAEGKEVKEPVPNEKEEQLKEKRPQQKTLRKDPAHRSMTALIPSGLGALLLLVWLVVVYRPLQRKHAMHFAALVGAAALGGGLYALFGGMGEFNEISGWAGPSLAEFWPSLGKDPSSRVSAWDQPKVRSGGLTALVGAVYVGMAVKSFIDARKAKDAATPPAA